MARFPHDLFDRRAASGLAENGGVDFFASQIALVLEALRRGEQRRVDERRAERRSYLAHRFAHRAEEGGAVVLHQMPAVGDLESVGKRLAGGKRKAAAAISRHNNDLRLTGEPCLSCRGLAVGKQLDRATALEVANDRPISLITLPGQNRNPDIVRSRRQLAPRWSSSHRRSKSGLPTTRAERLLKAAELSSLR